MDHADYLKPIDPSQATALLTLLAIGQQQIEAEDYYDGDTFFATLNALDGEGAPPTASHSATR